MNALSSSELPKHAIIFDFGGVFMKTLDYAPRHRWDDRLHLPHGTVERIVHGSETWRQAQLGTLSLSDYWADVAHQLNLTTDETHQLANDFYSGDQLDKQLVDYTRHIRAEGHPVALLSNDSPALLPKLQTLQIDNLFSPVVISATIGFMKPDARAYQYVLAALNRPASQTIFIDDMPANVAGANAVGIHAIQYTTLPALQAALTPLLNG